LLEHREITGYEPVLGRHRPQYALAMASARRHRQRHNAAAMRRYQRTENRHARSALDLAHDA
jgi:hypothetical protein